ncbi:hypothetical protein ACV247_005483 [Pseudomonas aeruginosa]|uniref:hypothetical protein n=1 Tax=Pseudomonas aeruginosa TaxID=287 RepID=UPI001068654A|nr:hypothetical protein [Pseudomonas aeruginosa]TEL34233.1 hypothetical protein IPC177_27380 [Pseudomonas aeruginosa]
MRIVCLLVLLSLIGGCSHSVTLQERAEQEAIFIQEFRQEFAKRLRYPLFAPGDEIPEADVMVFFRFASSSGRISSCRVQYGAGNDKSRSTLDEVLAKRVIATCREPDLPVAPPALLDGGGGFSFKQRVMFRKEVERLR